MPIIDVSQKSYRSLVKAAHKHGMSIDRFIQHSFSGVAEPQKSESPAVSPVQNELPAPPVQFVADKAVLSPERRPTAPQMGNVPTSSFEALWSRIEQSAGESISTKRGQDFTYEIEAGYLTVRESGARIPRSQFKKALNQWPQSGPSNMRGIYASSVVWAVLADERILTSAA
jgi:hypothetical protein